MLNQAIILNTDAHMQMRQVADVARYTPVGSPVEVGLLNFVSSQGKPVHELLINRENNYKLMSWIPFSSERRCMTVAFQIQDEHGNDVVRVIMKGAPETVIRKCSAKLDAYCESAHFEGHGDDGTATLNDIKRMLISDIVTEGDQQVPIGLKTLTFAYKDMSYDEFVEIKSHNQNFETEEGRIALESQLTYIATIGLSDPLRENIDAAIEELNNTSTNVRIVSGDHRAAVEAVAIRLGMKESFGPNDKDIMSGQELLEKLRGWMVETEDTEEGRGKTFVFQNSDSMKRFKRDVKKNVVFVYRATPVLKHMLVCALRQSGATVGVTGEGLGDARALSEANVGFTMG